MISAIGGLCLAIASLANTALIWMLWKKVENPSAVEVRFMPFEDDHPFLQLLVEEEDSPDEEEEVLTPSYPEPIDYGAWRNQKNIQPWAPNSSAPAQPAIPERKPLERPPGFV